MLLSFFFASPLANTTDNIIDFDAKFKNLAVIRTGFCH